MTSEWKRMIRLEVDAPDLGPHHRIAAEAGLHKLGGNPGPYWSVTGEVINTRRRGDNRIEVCGAIHPEILAAFPELAPIVALHLSDEDGVPMHAAANAMHWFGLTYDRGDHPWVAWPAGRDSAARHLRCTVEEVDVHREYVATDPNPAEAMRYLVRHVFGPTWKREAEQAHAWLDARVPQRVTS